MPQWDWDTSIEEIMHGLHALHLAGKILYLVCLMTSVITVLSRY